MRKNIIFFTILGTLCLSGCSINDGTNENNNGSQIISSNDTVQFDLKSYIENLGDNFSVSINGVYETEEKEYYSETYTFVETYKYGKNNNLKIFDESFVNTDKYNFNIGKYIKDFYPTLVCTEQTLNDVFLEFLNQDSHFYWIKEAFINNSLNLSKVDEGLYSCEYTGIDDGSTHGYRFLETEDPLVTKAIYSDLVGNALIGMNFKIYEKNLFEKFEEAIEIYDPFLHFLEDFNLFELFNNASYDEGTDSYKVEASRDENTDQLLFGKDDPTIACTFSLDENSLLKIHCTVDNDVFDASVKDVGTTTFSTLDTEEICAHQETKNTHYLINNKWYHVETCKSCSHLKGYEVVDGATGYCPKCTEDLLLVAYEPLTFNLNLTITYNSVTKIIKGVDFKYTYDFGNMYFGVYTHDITFPSFEREEIYVKIGNSPYALADFIYGTSDFYITRINDKIYFPKTVTRDSDDHDLQAKKWNFYYTVTDFYRNPIQLNVDTYNI